MTSELIDATSIGLNWVRDSGAIMFGWRRPRLGVFLCFEQQRHERSMWEVSVAPMLRGNYLRDHTRVLIPGLSIVWFRRLVEFKILLMIGGREPLVQEAVHNERRSYFAAVLTAQQRAQGLLTVGIPEPEMPADTGIVAEDWHAHTRRVTN